MEAPVGYQLLLLLLALLLASAPAALGGTGEGAGKGSHQKESKARVTSGRGRGLLRGSRLHAAHHRRSALGYTSAQIYAGESATPTYDYCLTSQTGACQPCDELYASDTLSNPCQVGRAVPNSRQFMTLN